MGNSNIAKNEETYGHIEIAGKEFVWKPLINWYLEHMLLIELG